MIKITCVNPQCRTKSFMWNEERELGSKHDLAKQGDAGAIRLVVSCTWCGTDNVIWVIRSGLKMMTVNRGTDE